MSGWRARTDGAPAGRHPGSSAGALRSAGGLGERYVGCERQVHDGVELVLDLVEARDLDVRHYLLELTDVFAPHVEEGLLVVHGRLEEALRLLVRQRLVGRGIVGDHFYELVLNVAHGAAI